MKKLLSMAVMACFMLAAGTVYADNVGCGFGRMFMKGKTGKVNEILAATTNGTSGSQTFAITSGTAGYKEGQTIGVNLVEEYVAQNMDNLATDIAKGDGEYVDTLASLMKVSNKVDFKAKLKTNFNNIYTSDGITSKEVVANINNIYNS